MKNVSKGEGLDSLLGSSDVGELIPRESEVCFESHHRGVQLTLHIKAHVDGFPVVGVADSR